MCLPWRDLGLNAVPPWYRYIPLMLSYVEVDGLA